MTVWEEWIHIKLNLYMYMLCMCVYCMYMYCIYWVCMLYMASLYDIVMFFKHCVILTEVITHCLTLWFSFFFFSTAAANYVPESTSVLSNDINFSVGSSHWIDFYSWRMRLWSRPTDQHSHKTYFCIVFILSSVYWFNTTYCNSMMCWSFSCTPDVCTQNTCMWLKLTSDARLNQRWRRLLKTAHTLHKSWEPDYKSMRSDEKSLLITAGLCVQRSSVSENCGIAIKRMFLVWTAWAWSVNFMSPLICYKLNVIM